ncbi:hypothetical protein [Enterococcus bulliens]
MDWQTIMKRRAERKARKKAMLRQKNAQLRAQGKNPLKGWGTMVDSGYGGINNGTSKLDTKPFLLEEQRRIRKK